MSHDFQIRVQRETFSLEAEYARLAKRSDCGAIVTFVGLVRDLHPETPLSGLTLEHYPGMTEKSLAAILDEACQRWPLLQGVVIHRVGTLAVGAPIVLVAISSQHRAAAFAACEFIMDALKTRAPFWKREEFKSGEAQWVAARGSDQEAAARWD